MGEFLNQCANDAWEVIQGRKKIVGNRIIDCNKGEKIKNESKDFGWLAPDGTFYSVDFGNHQAWASKYLLDEYRKGNIESKCNENPGDKLCEMGFILIHNPHGYNLSITRDLSKRITLKQKDFLLDYFEENGLTEWSYKLLENKL